MAKRKKKPVDTIRLEGLSADTIKDFAPKDNPLEEDKLWEEYFLGNPKVIHFPNREIDDTLPPRKNETKEKTTAVVNNTAVTAVTDVGNMADVTDATKATAVIKDPKIKKSKKTKEYFITLDSTHTKSEQLVYSIMYRQTISKDRDQQYFSLRKLMHMTGIGSDKTVFNALKGLRNKLSIHMVEHSNNKPTGTLYKVFTPKEIFKLREEKGILIDINTKRIVTTAVTEATVVLNNTQATQVGTTAATSVKNTAVKENIPYIKENKSINNDDSIKNIESSSEDEPFDHKKYIISLYKKYTGNIWSAADHKSYQTIKGIIPDIIEAALIASVLRAKTKVNSFAYCEGVIHEFTQNLAPGYLVYLRDKWQELKEKHRRKVDKETKPKSTHKP